MKTKIYLDNAATTRTAEEVVEAMIPYFTENYGNPSASMSWDREAKRLLPQHGSRLQG